MNDTLRLILWVVGGALACMFIASAMVLGDAFVNHEPDSLIYDLIGTNLIVLGFAGCFVAIGLPLSRWLQ